MTAFKGVNVTKYDAGGSGDNYIPDGYIKSVEKVWMDSFTFSAVLTTADTVAIATIPPNKKITSVEVYFPALTPTDCTINVGITGDADKFIKTAPVATSLTEVGALVAINKVESNNPDGFQFVTTAETDILFSLANKAITAPTAGTITTIVRYT
jgi:hypothetical protein